MSHVEKMELIAKSLSAIDKTAQEHGGELIKADRYNWYGRHVGDYPIPKGFTRADMGKCDYKIRFPGIQYEVGVVKNPDGEGYVLMYDFYDRKLSEKIGGPKALKLHASLWKHQQIEAAEKRGLKWKEVKKGNKLELYTYLK